MGLDLFLCDLISVGKWKYRIREPQFISRDTCATLTWNTSLLVDGALQAS